MMAVDLILKDGSTYQITDDVIEMFQRTYQRIRVEEECAKMAAWCFSNPSKRKTKRGVLRFINNWLNSADTNVKQQPGMVYAQSHATDYTGISRGGLPPRDLKRASEHLKALKRRPR